MTSAPSFGGDGAPAAPLDDADADPPPASTSSAGAPPAPADNLVLRKDPHRRATASWSMGRGLAALAMLSSLVPVMVVAAALWPASAPSVPAPGGAAVDVAARVAVDAPKSLPLAPAGPAVVAPAAVSLAFDPARTAKARGLIKRVFKARDARRAAGASLPELRKPFTIAELGGNAAIAEAGIEAGRRLLISRPDGKVIAPIDAPAPEGVDLSSQERDEDLLEVEATLQGEPVHILRRCFAGELLCLVDIEKRQAPAPQPSTAAPPPPSPPEQPTNAAVIPVAVTSAPSPQTRVPPWTSLGLGVALALILGGALAWRLSSTGSLLAAAAHRLRALAAGRAGGSPTDVPAEVATLHAAIDECALALGDARGRAVAAEAHRMRLAEVSETLERARERAASRVPTGEDDASTGAVVAAANALLDSFEERVVRWKSHVDTVDAPAGPSRPSPLGARVQSLASVPPLLVEVAQRLMRVARVPELPVKAKDELNALGEALASRGRTAQTLIDMLLLDAAADRAAPAPHPALSSLRSELNALSPNAHGHMTVAALRDLPLAELARRVASSEKP